MITPSTRRGFIASLLAAPAALFALARVAKGGGPAKLTMTDVEEQNAVRYRELRVVSYPIKPVIYHVRYAVGLQHSPIRSYEPLRILRVMSRSADGTPNRCDTFGYRTVENMGAGLSIYRDVMWLDESGMAGTLDRLTIQIVDWPSTPETPAWARGVFAIANWSQTSPTTTLQNPVSCGPGLPPPMRNGWSIRGDGTIVGL